MLLVRHTIPEATWSDFWIGKLNDNFITNLLLTDTHSNTVRVSNEQLPSMQGFF